VFLDHAFVPDSGLIGEPGQGWDVATTMLMSERSSLGGGTSAGSPDELIALARKSYQDEDPRVRNRLASLYADASILQWSIQRAQAGGHSPVSGLLKLMYSQHARRMTNATMELLGGAGVAGPLGDAESAATDWQNRFLFAPERNTIAERTLGLPCERRPASALFLQRTHHVTAPTPQAATSRRLHPSARQ
jgi:alkylation response protein AidB-like acyl-CoA dehydrogenase